MLPSSARSIANFLAGPYLDRRAEERENPRWLDDALTDPTTLFLPVSGTALGVAGEPPAPAFLEASHPLIREVDRRSPVLLGWFRERRCVLVQIAREAEQPSASLRFEELRPLAPLLETAEAGLLAYARALVWWQQRHRFCGVCGAPALPVRAGHVMRCTVPACASEFFPRIDPAIIVLVRDGDRALLGRQAIWPAGRYSTIAGFVEPGESLEDAVAREVFEETRVQVAASDYHSSQPWPFPSSLMLGFMAEAVPGSVPQGGDELEDARWFSRADIAAGAVTLPPPTSISHRLIETWFDAGSSMPLRSLPQRFWTPAARR
jgi:NAD+ diphosphatase